MILVVAAMKRELKGFMGASVALEDREEVRLCYTGIGRRNVMGSIKSWKNYPRPEAVFSVGFAGSVHPDFGFGQLCLIDRVTTEESKDCYRASEPLIDLLSDHEKTKVTSLLTVNQVLSTSEEKKSIWRNYEQPIVDQESYWIAQFADEIGVPFIGLRIVYDEIDQELPPKDIYEDVSGRVSFTKFLPWLAGHPGSVISLPSLGIKSILARRSLAREVDHSVQLVAGVN